MKYKKCFFKKMQNPIEEEDDSRELMEIMRVISDEIMAKHKTTVKINDYLINEAKIITTNPPKTDTKMI